MDHQLYTQQLLLELLQRITVLATKISSLDDHVDSLTTRLDVLQEAVKNLSHQVAGVQDSIRVLQADVSVNVDDNLLAISGLMDNENGDA